MLLQAVVERLAERAARPALAALEETISELLAPAEGARSAVALREVCEHRATAVRYQGGLGAATAGDLANALQQRYPKASAVADLARAVPLVRARLHRMVSALTAAPPARSGVAPGSGAGGLHASRGGGPPPAGEQAAGLAGHGALNTSPVPEHGTVSAAEASSAPGDTAEGRALSRGQLVRIGRPAKGLPGSGAGRTGSLLPQDHQEPEPWQVPATQAVPEASVLQGTEQHPGDFAPEPVPATEADPAEPAPQNPAQAAAQAPVRGLHPRPSAETEELARGTGVFTSGADPGVCERDAAPAETLAPLQGRAARGSPGPSGASSGSGGRAGRGAPCAGDLERALHAVPAGPGGQGAGEPGAEAAGTVPYHSTPVHAGPAAGALSSPAYVQVREHARGRCRASSAAACQGMGCKS